MDLATCVPACRAARPRDVRAAVARRAARAAGFVETRSGRVQRAGRVREHVHALSATIGAAIGAPASRHATRACSGVQSARVGAGATFAAVLDSAREDRARRGEEE